MSYGLIKKSDAIEVAKAFWYKPDIAGALAELPTIEPKRGEWVKRTHDTLIAQVNFAYCSECGQPIMHEHTRPLWFFCPNCGAEMREREGE